VNPVYLVLGMHRSGTSAATQLLAVLEGLGPEQSGFVHDWKGERIPE
jgi:hypothetical protein